MKFPGLGSLSRAIKDGYIHGVVELSDLDSSTSLIDSNKPLKVENQEIVVKTEETTDSNGNIEDSGIGEENIPNKGANG